MRRLTGGLDGPSWRPTTIAADPGRTCAGVSMPAPAGLPMDLTRPSTRLGRRGGTRRVAELSRADSGFPICRLQGLRANCFWIKWG